MVKYQISRVSEGTLYHFIGLDKGDVYVLPQWKGSNEKARYIGNLYNRQSIWAPSSYSAFSEFVNAFVSDMEQSLISQVVPSYQRRYAGGTRYANYTTKQQWDSTFPKVNS